MVRYLGLFSFFIFFGCEINSKQIIKPERFSYDIIKFDTVSKNFYNEINLDTLDHKNLNQIIHYWFDNRIKVDGFNGELFVYVKKVEFIREKKQNYYKFTISLSLEFIEQSSNNLKKTYEISSNEYGEITGDFSINDQENLDINLMHQALESISKKLSEII